MAVIVYIHTPFRRATGNRDRVEVRTTDVRAMLDELEARQPGLRVLVRGAERRHMPFRNVQDQMHARDPITFSRTARNAYYMDPIDALKLNRLADEGFAFAVIYHSHPNAGAYFSETDRGQALIRGE